MQTCQQHLVGYCTKHSQAYDNCIMSLAAGVIPHRRSVRLEEKTRLCQSLKRLMMLASVLPPHQLRVIVENEFRHRAVGAPTHMHFAQDGDFSPEITKSDLITALKDLGCHVAAVPLGFVDLTKLPTACTQSTDLSKPHAQTGDPSPATAPPTHTPLALSTVTLTTPCIMDGNLESSSKHWWQWAE